MIVSNKDWHLRYSEMELISYYPHHCKKGGTIENCSELVAYARYNIREAKVGEAQ